MTLSNANASSDSSPDTVSGTDPNVGQPAGSETWEGQPNAGQEDVKPAGEDTTSNENNEPAKDEAYYEKQYKELQTDYGQKNEAHNEMMQKFAQFGGPDAMLEVMNYLNNSEEFAGFLKQEQTKQYGVDVEANPEQAEAIKLVENMIHTVMKKDYLPMLEEKIQPLAESDRNRVVNEHLDTLTDKYPEWAQQAQTMKKLSNNLPENVRNNPSYEVLEALYFQSLTNDGKMGEYAKNLLKNEMDKKRENSSDLPPSSSGSPDVGNIETMLDAFTQAKKDLGITGEVRGLM